MPALLARSFRCRRFVGHAGLLRRLARGARRHPHVAAPRGRLLFTLEHASNEDEIPEGYRIQHGRYSRTEPYVRKTLGETDFEVIDIEKAEPTPGRRTLCRRAGRAASASRAPRCDSCG